MFHKPREENAQKPAAPAAQRQALQQKGQPARTAGVAIPPSAKTGYELSQKTQKSQTTSYHKEEERQTMSPYQNQNNEEKTEQENRQPEPPAAAQQRSGQTPPGASRIPGSYASGYPGYGGNAPAQNEALSRGRKLIVGEGISMSGEIDACDHLIVEGKVEAALKGASLLDIAESGVFYGTVEIEEATIAGRFEGDLTVNGRLTIKSSGSITGAISYKELAVEAGAVVDGKISPLRDRNETRRADSRTKGAEARSRKEQQGQAEEEGSLPFDSNVEAAE